MEKYKPSQKEIKKAEDMMTPKEETMSDIRAGKLAQFKSFFEENPVTGVNLRVLEKYAESLSDDKFKRYNMSDREKYLENKYGKEVRDGIEFIKKSGEKLPLPRITTEALRKYAYYDDKEFNKKNYVPDSKEEKDYLSKHQEEFRMGLEQIRRRQETGFMSLNDYSMEHQLADFEEHFNLKKGESIRYYNIDKLKNYLGTYARLLEGGTIIDIFKYSSSDYLAINQEVSKVISCDGDHGNSMIPTSYECVYNASNEERFEKMKKTLEKFKRTPEDREKYEREKLEEERSGRNASQK